MAAPARMRLVAESRACPAAGAGPAAACGRPERLPLPEVADTCARCLDLIEPLVPPQDFERVTALAGQLAATAAPLQTELRRLAAERDGDFVGGFWRDMYLRLRHPLAPFQNPGLLFRLPAAIARHGLARRAAAIAVASARLARQIAVGEHRSEIEAKQPLCRTQDRYAFGTVRLPGLRRDRVRQTSLLRHFIVAHAGRFYALPLPDGDSLAAEIACLEPQLQAILADRRTSSGTGALTCLPRAEWHRCRRRLRRDPVNRASLRAMETASFVVCLEPDLRVDDRAELASAVLHGDPANRWYDRISQFILFAAPYMGVNGEHSVIDGHAACTLLETICASVCAQAAPAMPAGASVPEPLAWQLGTAAAELVAAVQAAAATRASLHLGVGDADGTGPGLRDDVRAQLAVQLAHYQLTGRVEAVYQPTHMRRYARGRTEAVRPVSASTIGFCRAMAEGRDPVQRLRELGRRAVRSVLERARAAQDGNGIERHLFALLQVARRRGEVPDLFRDPTFAEVMGPAILCTSSLSGFPHLDLIVFAPVRADGFGIGYVPNHGRITFCVTGHRPDTPEFLQRLIDACATLRPILHPGGAAADTGP